MPVSLPIKRSAAGLVWASKEFSYVSGKKSIKWCLQIIWANLSAWQAYGDKDQHHYNDKMWIWIWSYVCCVCTLVLWNCCIRPCSSKQINLMPGTIIWKRSTLWCVSLMWQPWDSGLARPLTSFCWMINIRQRSIQMSENIGIGIYRPAWEEGI